MRVEYKLKETCKWSVGNPVEFRYVDVFIEGLSGTGPHVTLQLPEAAATELVKRMASASEPSAGATSSVAAWDTGPHHSAGDIEQLYEDFGFKPGREL